MIILGVPTFSIDYYETTHGARFVAKVAKTFGVTRVNTETLGEFRYAFSSRTWVRRQRVATHKW
jgi:hypothetical protein